MLQEMSGEDEVLEIGSLDDDSPDSCLSFEEKTMKREELFGTLITFSTLILKHLWQSHVHKMLGTSARAENIYEYAQIVRFDKELNRYVAIKVIDLEEAMSRPIQKEWMNELDRFGDVYKQGVADFIQFANVSTTCPCPCRECRNGKSFVFGTISRHLIKYGIDKNYRVRVLHGENPCTDPVVEPVIEEENTEVEGLGMGNFVDASYGVHEVVAGDLNEDEENHMEDFEPPPVLERDLGKRYNEYKKMAEQKLYPSCEAPVTTLSAVVDLHNLKKKYGFHLKWYQVNHSLVHLNLLVLPHMHHSLLLQFHRHLKTFKDMQESENVRKLPVLIDIDGVVVGDNASRWNTRAGSLIRACIPVSYTDWRLVHPNFKDKVWNALMREFEVTNVDQALARSHAEKNFCTKFRYGKWVLRKDILNKFETLEEQIAMLGWH
ncbi:hypothetical protein IFM89_006715 [Coptis chinensis]|uniref:Transposase-associated domain-containing protein n=1 Tax=Coptis chinensis TaxID=261450 RepID=A0A835HCJ6_9MAGN|nr:hypothetical protein IFM89_006715 [Coptis chinensis]